MVAKLMTNLLPEYFHFLKTESKRQRKTMRQILEEAIAIYKREKKKAYLIAGYEKMAQDKEFLAENLAMAEEGMSYYLSDLENAERNQ